jgi:hypothetical protein
VAKEVPLNPRYYFSPLKLYIITNGHKKFLKLILDEIISRPMAKEVP